MYVVISFFLEFVLQNQSVFLIVLLKGASPQKMQKNLLLDYDHLTQISFEI